MAFHEKAGRSQVDSCRASWNNDLFSRRVATAAMLPSALSRSDSFRSVHIGRSRLSRCCHLISALWFCSCGVEPGPGDRRSHRNSALGFCLFSSWNGFDFVLRFVLRSSSQCRSVAVVQRFVDVSTDPQVMQQHRQLPRSRHDGWLSS